MPKLVLTKTYLLQFLNLDRHRQDYVLDSMKFLLDVLDFDAEPEYDIIDEYDIKDVESKPFPLTYHVDHDKDAVYFINIEKSYRQHRRS